MSPPWMPLYVSDYLADTAHLSAAEHGAYLLLIMHYWQKGALPDDDRQLARIARMNDRAWAASKMILAAFFEEGWRHPRIEKELAKAEGKTGKRIAAAEAGAQQRWGGVGDRKTRSQRLAEARSVGTHTQVEWLVLEALFDRCVQCRIPRSELRSGMLCKDHITPIYQGGSDAIDNIQPMCRACNSRKALDCVDLRDDCLPGWRGMYAERLRLAGTPQAFGNAECMASSSQPEKINTSLRSVSARNARPKSVRTPIDPDAQPTQADQDHATSIGMTLEVFRFEWPRFRDHHLKVGSSFASWPAAWRTWCANWLERGGLRQARAGPFSSRPPTMAEMSRMDEPGFSFDALRSDNQFAAQAARPPNQGPGGFAECLSLTDRTRAQRDVVDS